MSLWKIPLLEGHAATIYYANAGVLTTTPTYQPDQGIVPTGATKHIDTLTNFAIPTGDIGTKFPLIQVVDESVTYSTGLDALTTIPSSPMRAANMPVTINSTTKQVVIGYTGGAWSAIGTTPNFAFTIGHKFVLDNVAPGTTGITAGEVDTYNLGDEMGIIVECLINYNLSSVSPASIANGSQVTLTFLVDRPSTITPDTFVVTGLPGTWGTPVALYDSSNRYKGHSITGTYAAPTGTVFPITAPIHVKATSTYDYVSGSTLLTNQTVVHFDQDVSSVQVTGINDTTPPVIGTTTINSTTGGFIYDYTSTTAQEMLHGACIISTTVTDAESGLDYIEVQVDDNYGAGLALTGVYAKLTPAGGSGAKTPQTFSIPFDAQRICGPGIASRFDVSINAYNTLGQKSNKAVPPHSVAAAFFGGLHQRVTMLDPTWWNADYTNVSGSTVTTVNCLGVKVVVEGGTVLTSKVEMWVNGVLAVTQTVPDANPNGDNTQVAVYSLNKNFLTGLFTISVRAYDKYSTLMYVMPDFVIDNTKVTNYCVPAGTLIETPNGQLPVEDVVVGNFVRAYNEHTFAPTIAEVTAAKQQDDINLFEVTTSMGTLVCSNGHLIWSKEAKEKSETIVDPHWVPVEELAKGDVTKWDLNGVLVDVPILKVKNLKKKATVYHLGLSHGHVYIAGNVPAHNKIYTQNTCVPAGTLINTPYGYVPVETLEIGNRLVSFNENTLEPGTATIVGVIKEDDQELVEVIMEHGSLVCTPSHLIYSKLPKESKYPHWPFLYLMEPGDITLYETSSGLVESRIISINKLNRFSTVYHFALDTEHVYVAGGVPTHNAIYDPTLDYPLISKL